MASNGRRKEAVIVIVEGYSDRDALDGILRQLYKNKNHAFAFAMGDITSDEDSNPDNIEEKPTCWQRPHLTIKSGDLAGMPVILPILWIWMEPLFLNQTLCTGITARCNTHQN